MNCPVCGSPYIYGGVSGQNSHARCLIEQTERAKDAEFLRALRAECQQRGLEVQDFLAALFCVLDREILTRGNDI